MKHILKACLLIAFVTARSICFLEPSRSSTQSGKYCLHTIKLRDAPKKEPIITKTNPMLSPYKNPAARPTRLIELIHKLT